MLGIYIVCSAVRLNGFVMIQYLRPMQSVAISRMDNRTLSSTNGIYLRFLTLKISTQIF